MGANTSQIIDDEWVTFPGGELEGRRPRALCQACRADLARAANGKGERRRQATLCFQCYRADLDRDRAIRASGELDTASEARFQSLLPFEPVNRPRLGVLKADRAASRAVASTGFETNRRRAQIAARHALQSIADGLRSRHATAADRHHAMADAIHAAELQLPDSWLPFVMAR